MMNKRALWYLTVGLLCLCMGALLVSASTPPKPQTGTNGPLALKEELKWSAANGQMVPTTGKWLPSTMNHRGLPEKKVVPDQTKVFKAPREEQPMVKVGQSLSKFDPTATYRVDASKRAAEMKRALQRPTGRMTLDSEVIPPQGFEEGIMPPTGWSVIVTDNTDPTYTWYPGTFAYEGSYAAQCLYDDQYSMTQDEWIVSPAIDMTTITAPACYVSFYWAMSYYWGVSPYDNYDIELRVSLDGGTTWETTVLWNEDNVGTFSSWTYYQAVVDVSAYLSYTNVKFGWRYTGFDGAEADLDYIRIYTPEECDIVCGPTDIVEAPETADSTWMAHDPNGGCNNDPTDYQWDAVACGDTLCGNGFTYLTPGLLQYRDMDWYQFSLTAPETVSVWAQAEFPMVVYIATDNCANTQILAFGTAEICVPIEFGVCLDAGNYVLIVAPSVFTGVDTPAPYRATLKCNGTCTPPQPYDCAAPYLLPTETGEWTGLATCGAGNDYTETCLDYYDGGEDVVFQWTVTTPGNYMITMDPLGTTWTGLAVDDECPLAGTGCLGVSTHYDATPDTIACQYYAAGTYYIMVDTWPSPDCIPAFNLKIETCVVPTGACCYGEDPFAPLCATVTLAECQALSGTWYGGQDCGTFSCPLPPANDLCTDAIAVGIPSSTVGTTVQATVDNAPFCVTSITTAGVWYTVTGTGTTITASTCNAYTTYDTKISVYCGSCEDLICITGNDDNCAEYSLRSLVTWCSQAGATYYILVHGFSTATGDFQLDVSEDGVPCEPTVTCMCEPVTNLTAYKVPTGVEARFTAPVPGVYTVWTTTVKNNDGDPNGGLDPDFSIGAELLSLTGSEVLSWIDTTVLAFEEYVVTSKCGASGRCCYGPDPENPLCANVPLVVCDALGGQWTAGVSCETSPCVCPPGATPENEPDCYDEYVDATNGGCNSTPNVFGSITCGETICGYSGTYLFGGGNYRDTDWFELVTTEPETLVWSVTAEFDVTAFILTGTCDNIVVLASGSALAGQPLVISTGCRPAGTYWLWVGPSVFSGVPCGSRWIGTVNCFPCEIAACTPDYVLDGTGTVSGNTCGALNDCDTRPSEDQIVQVNITTPGLYTFSLCTTSPAWDTYMYLDATCCDLAHIAFNDDYCGLVSQISDVNLAAGTYYVLIEGYSNTYCGAWTLTVTTPPPCTPDYSLTDAGVVNGTTCGMINDYSNTCLGYYDDGEDVIIQWTVTTPGNYRIRLNPQGTSYTGIVVDDDCPPASTGCLGMSTNSGTTEHSIICQAYAAGTYYIMVDTWPSPQCIPSFTVTIETCTIPVPDFTITDLGTVSGNTCGAANDCGTRASEDQIVQWNVTTAGTYTLALCSSSPVWDSYMYLDAGFCSATHLRSDDDGCGTLLSRISSASVSAGTYYILIEGYSTSYCGAWTLDITTP